LKLSEGITVSLKARTLYAQMSAELFFCDFCKSAEIQKVSFQAMGMTIMQYK